MLPADYSSAARGRHCLGCPSLGQFCSPFAHMSGPSENILRAIRTPFADSTVQFKIFLKSGWAFVLVLLGRIWAAPFYAVFLTYFVVKKSWMIWEASPLLKAVLSQHKDELCVTYFRWILQTILLQKCPKNSPALPIYAWYAQMCQQDPDMPCYRARKDSKILLGLQVNYKLMQGCKDIALELMSQHLDDT